MTSMLDRAYQVNFRVSREEKKALEEMCAAWGLSLSDTIRQIARQAYEDMKTAGGSK